MFDYTVSAENDPKKFEETCFAIEKALTGFKSELLIDVDGTTIQIYEKSGKHIKVYDDYDVGAVYVLSDVDIGNLLLRE